MVHIHGISTGAAWVPYYVAGLVQDLVVLAANSCAFESKIRHFSYPLGRHVTRCGFLPP